MELQKWINKNIPEDSMIWKSSSLNQMIFVRDRVSRIFYHSDFEVKITVVGTHTSKSIELPVYMVEIPGIKFIMRDNFHDWKVSVISCNPLPGLHHTKTFDQFLEINSIYCEGFEENMVFSSYFENNVVFTVEILNKYDLFMFLKTIANKIL